ncbi:Pre-mRNA-splicing factor SPF27 [Bombardia bombarda]|uniref:Pre-mRNA-splicing factor SPF27 n=1 Tax=Bombardia bombarda TaxID=252184 RepID=A0AA39WIP2_9PEZI|nr:Pre-mRNA-splicing factor SPF27 [Bombardia bombarda]
MPSITVVHESLPYIDAEPNPTERAAAEALIATERSLVPDDPFHALLPPQNNTTYLTPLLEAELSRAATSTKLDALDLTRYEAFDPPSPEELASLTPRAAKAKLTSLLSLAYATQTYVSQRRAHLALLDSYGKNAWLVGNWHLEAELKSLEKELAETRRAIDVVTLQRKGAQDEAGPELKGLEETWKRGIGRVLETEAAAEGLRREVLEASQRSMAIR